MVKAKMSYFWPKKGLVGPNLQKKQIILIYIVLLKVDTILFKEGII